MIEGDEGGKHGCICAVQEMIAVIAGGGAAVAMGEAVTKEMKPPVLCALRSDDGQRMYVRSVAADQLRRHLMADQEAQLESTLKSELLVVDHRFVDGGGVKARDKAEAAITRSSDMRDSAYATALSSCVYAPSGVDLIAKMYAQIATSFTLPFPRCRLYRRCSSPPLLPPPPGK